MAAGSSSPRAARSAPQESRRGSAGATAANDLEAWMHIDERGKVTAFTGKVEIGQNIRTSLTQVVADELRVPLGRLRW